MFDDDAETFGDQIPRHSPRGNTQRETGGQPGDGEEPGVPAERGASPAAAETECATDDHVAAPTPQRDGEGVDETGEAQATEEGGQRDGHGSGLADVTDHGRWVEDTEADFRSRPYSTLSSLRS